MKNQTLINLKFTVALWCMRLTTRLVRSLPGSKRGWLQDLETDSGYRKLKTRKVARETACLT